MNVWVGIDPGEKRIGMARADTMVCWLHPGVSANRDELLRWLKSVEEDLACRRHRRMPPKHGRFFRSHGFEVS